MSSIDKKFGLEKSKNPDPTTLSNYVNFTVKNTDLNLHVCFQEQVVEGVVVFELVARQDTEEAILDTSFLNIHEVSVVNSQNELVKVKYHVGERRDPLGSPLKIKYSATRDTSFKLRIAFSTTEKCTALQFMSKESTDGKIAPYMFSQCQANHARSLFPCFDTPAVKSTYNMTVKSPYPVLMSGRHVGSEEGVYRFYQPVPIPSYLVAIASGNLTSARIGVRSHIYCEPEKIDACQYEFENDMERFLEAIEAIVFRYQWDQYDVLVLPSSFPYGGMENPNITFATPTIISGDRENIDVIAHELAHSWSGNLVTNYSWEHFWLNEGWTVYLERRIQDYLHGEPTRQFSAIIGWSDLENSISSMGESAEKYSTLVQDLSDGSDPDDSFSTVPYEKGFNLLYLIEKVVGGKESFDPFIPYYFGKFKHQSLDTYEFIDTLYDFFKDKKEKLDSIDWDTWLYKPGMPPVNPKFDTTLADQCYDLANRWYHAVVNGRKDFGNHFFPNDVKEFTSSQSVVFLETMLSYDQRREFKWFYHPEALNALSNIYSDYSVTLNAEVLSRWLILHVTGHNESYYDKLGDWLGTVGRMKFVRRGYLALQKADKEKAVFYFKKFENFYHPICRQLVKKDLNLS